MELTAQGLGTALAPSPALLGGVLSASAIVALAAEQGGFFPPSWRAGTAAFIGAICLLALWTRPRAGRAAAVSVAALGGLTLLSLASALWSIEPSASILDAQRTVLYCTAFASFVLAGEGLVAGVVVGVGVVGGWALLARFLSGSKVDAYEGRLLSDPIGYANGLGALMAIGLVCCLVLAVRDRRLIVALVPALVLVPALALTASRASFAAAAVGGAVGVALVSGHRGLAFATAAVAAALLAVLLVIGPRTVGDRAAYWGGARTTIAARPLGGTGAGTFGVAHPHAPYARDAHSLYLQTLVELGPVGLLLVLVALGVPLVLALHRGLAAPAAGLTVFVLHAGVDWDWQLPAVTLAALALAGAGVTRPISPPR